MFLSSSLRPPHGLKGRAIAALDTRFPLWIPSPTTSSFRCAPRRQKAGVALRNEHGPPCDLRRLDAPQKARNGNVLQVCSKDVTLIDVATARCAETRPSAPR